MRSLFCSLLSAALLAPLAAWSTPLTITVPKQVLVRRPQITIGEVADIKGGSASLRARVQEIVVGHAPAAGQTRTLYSAHIITRLKQHGLHTPTVRLNAPTRISITRASQRLASRQIETAVIRAIRAAMPWPSHRVTIRSLRGVESVILPPGPVRSEVSFPVHTDFVGPISFTVSFRVAGNMEKRMYGSATIEVMQEVVTTSRPIGRHETMAAADLRLTKMSLARLPRRVFTRLDDVVGKRTKRALEAYTVVRAHDVETVPLVRKGDAVLILVESPLLKVSTLGEALEPGQRDDTIRVRNASSQREIRAVVVDRKTVRVPF